MQHPEVIRGLNECIVRLEPDNGRRISASMQVLIIWFMYQLMIYLMNVMYPLMISILNISVYVENFCFRFLNLFLQKLILELN